ncbi:DUF3419 family protein [Rhizobiaceae bacterium BDR2-2]|uniref:DUF3419 family protein n=1 Tax=Ectorhizobium quercum TaxID=2965071 RepID=A0AAE3MY87_9HYPH|nr:DUF3419 family protein [Ectorhizobium quercum]MCX8996481.1 DUF3419 family protein [Ectorhizobium quercum]
MTRHERNPIGNGPGKVGEAMLRHRTLSADGLSERLFRILFSGLVYPQIWEDPEVDMEAMDLAPGHRIVTIGSGGCNMLAYLSRSPARIDVVDLNRHHVALNRLKLAAFRHLPGHDDVLRHFIGHNLRGNVQAYDRFVAPHLDPETRAYWNRRGLTARRRITMFNGNIYRKGLLGRFIGTGHAIARLHGVKLKDITAARTIEEQERFFETRVAPLFDKPAIRWATSRKSSLFGLGIPPQQFDELAGASGDGTVGPVLKERLRRLACGFPLESNYFAWQAFARRYPAPGEGPLPAYLRPDYYAAIKASASRVSVHHESVTDLLARRPAASVDRYCLLDAQDWMTTRQLNALWREITRTAAPGARVIFRTAAEASILPERLDPGLINRWHYRQDESRAFTARDRSAIYGGFHLYERLDA